jgi:hypothetical protein
VNESKTQRTPLAGEGPRKPSPYASRFNKHLTAWKQATTTLPPEAKLPGLYLREGKLEGVYPICLPREFAALNLLPEVRAGAIALFADLDIRWHDHVDGGPSNHLRDSQVQCVNALFAMVSDPERIKRAFGSYVDIDEVLEIEPGRFLTFEYIGPIDPFREGIHHGVEVGRERGSKSTSVDAAFKYRTSGGVIELALVEWKFTEAYAGRSSSRGSNATREQRYRAAWEAADGAVRTDLVDLDVLFDEPFYQLVRQQLLAQELERAGAEGAHVVRVLHVLDPANEAYQHSLPRPELRALGETVDDVWSRLLRRPDRFQHVDPAVFLDAAVTSPEYVARYALPA